MMAEDIVLTVSDALNHARIPYMVVGAFVGIYYGITRTTEDADFLLQVHDLDLTSLRHSLGPAFSVDPQTGFESITLGIHYVASHKDSDFAVDLFLLRDDPHDQLSFSRRRLISFDRGQTFIPPPEDFVITKLRWFNRRHANKDIDDARNVLAVQQGHLDLAYIRHWCSQHGTLALLEETLQSIPPLPPA